MHDMLPHVALEKHAIVGAGLTWKRIHGSSTGIRPEQKQPGDVPDTTPCLLSQYGTSMQSRHITRSLIDTRESRCSRSGTT